MHYIEYRYLVTRIFHCWTEVFYLIYFLHVWSTTVSINFKWIRYSLFLHLDTSPLLYTRSTAVYFSRVKCNAVFDCNWKQCFPHSTAITYFPWDAWPTVFDSVVLHPFLMSEIFGTKKLCWSPRTVGSKSVQSVAAIGSITWDRAWLPRACWMCWEVSGKRKATVLREQDKMVPI